MSDNFLDKMMEEFLADEVEPDIIVEPTITVEPERVLAEAVIPVQPLKPSSPSIAKPEGSSSVSAKDLARKEAEIKRFKAKLAHADAQLAKAEAQLVKDRKKVRLNELVALGLAVETWFKSPSATGRINPEILRDELLRVLNSRVKDGQYLSRALDAFNRLADEDQEVNRRVIYGQEIQRDKIASRH